MGSTQGEDATKHTAIYDLSIREIDLVLKKLESDNMNLRRDLHESRVKLNDKDEEILRLRRELLSQKKETLFAIRKVMSLTEEFKMDQVENINNFSLNIYACNDKDVGKWNSINCSSSSGQLAAISDESSKFLTFPVPMASHASVTVGEEVSTSMCSADEQHVKHPLNYQYRHLRLQLHSSNSTIQDATSVGTTDFDHVD